MTPNPKNFKCTFCGKVSLSLSMHKTHVRIHADERPFKCKRCDYAAKNEYHLKDHKKSATALSHCEICPSKFCNRRLLMMHMKEFHAGKHRKSTDSQCSARNVAPVKVDRAHVEPIQQSPVQVAEPAEEVDPLEITNKDFHIMNVYSIASGSIPNVSAKADRGSLSESRKSDKRTKNSLAKTKPKKSLGRKARSSSTRHKRTYAECPYCKKALRADVMTEHLNAHTGENLHYCNRCSYSTAYKRNLFLHVKKYQNETILECYHCDFTACHHRFLTQHVQKEHLVTTTDFEIQPDVEEAQPWSDGRRTTKTAIVSPTRSTNFQELMNNSIVANMEDLYKCKFCDYEFSSFRDLKIHEQVHTTTKIFRCKTCSRVFRKMENLRVHEKLHLRYSVGALPEDEFEESDGNSKQPKVEMGTIIEDTIVGISHHQQNESWNNSESVGQSAPQRTIQNPFFNNFSKFKPRKFVTVVQSSKNVVAAQLIKKSLGTVGHKKFTGFNLPRTSLQFSTNFLASNKSPQAKPSSSDSPDDKKNDKYHCTHCSYSTSNMTYLKRHEDTHTGDKGFKCALCFYRSIRIHDVIRHERQTHGVLVRRNGSIGSSTSP